MASNNIESISQRIESYPPSENDDQTRSRTNENSSKRTSQYFAAFSATIGGMIMGTCIGWSGPALHLLRPNETDHSKDVFPISDLQSTFIASLMPAGALFGGMSGGFFINKLGRKGTMMYNSVFFALSYLCLAAAQNVWMLFVGRFLSGMASGITSIATPTYLSEIASPSVRGMLGSCFQLMVTIGVLYVGIIGAFLSWQWLSVACLALTLIWGLLMSTCPESPVYLCQKGDEEAARASMQKLRGEQTNIEEELLELQEGIEATANKTFVWTTLLETVNLKPLIVALMLMLGQQLSGVNAVIFFSVTIFNAAKTSLPSLLENVIVGGVQVVATAMAAILIDRLGRRVLLLSSALVMIFSLYGLGLYFWMLEHNPAEAGQLGFLPLSCLCLFIAAFSLGFGPIPWLMMSELFSPEVKGVTSSISAAFNWTLAFLVTEFYLPVSKQVGIATTYWFFATVLLMVMAFTVFVIPETKGKSLEQIQQHFRGTPSQDDEEALIDDNVEATIEAEVNAEINTVQS